MRHEQLYKLLAKVTEPSGPQFYRKLYGLGANTEAMHIHSMEQWGALPFLQKEDLLAKPLRERAFISLSQIDHLRPSSGTSGKGVLFSPRTPLRGMDYRLKYHDFKHPILAYTVPAMPHWHEHFAHTHGAHIQSVVFDPKHSSASVKIARDAGVDSMSLFAFHIPLVGEHMKREGIASRIRFIEIAGESCTRSLFKYMRETFPNATILPFYGSSEVEDSPIGMPCRPITGEEPLSIYHGKESHYIELRDTESGLFVTPTAGAEGELVITAHPGDPSSFPLLRFRTGDMVRVVEECCQEHKNWSFTILGRSEMDFVKILGGVLRVDEVERVLHEAHGRVSDHFEMHHFLRETPEGPKTQVVLHVEPVSQTNLDALAEFVSERVRISPVRRYADGVRSGMYLPLVCIELEGSRTHGKTKRMFQH